MPSPLPRSTARIAELGASLLVSCIALSSSACTEGHPPPAGSNPGARDAAAHATDASFGPPGWRNSVPDPVVTLPYDGPVVYEDLAATARPRALDVHFSIDATHSFGEEIGALQRSLEQDIVPDLRRHVDDLEVGVSGFADFPVAPFGTPEDAPFHLWMAVTDDRSDVDEALQRLDERTGMGGDPREAGAEALWQIATGRGLAVDGHTIIAPSEHEAGLLGGVGFRPEALHVVVHATDAETHSPQSYGSSVPGTHGVEAAGAALAALPARLVGIASRPQARPHLERLAERTGAIVDAHEDGCATGIQGSERPARHDRCPLVFDVASDGSGLAGTITDAIVELLEEAAFARVHGVAVEDPHGFIQALEAVSPHASDEPRLSDRHPAGDGVLDTFERVRPGTRLRFRIHLRNRSVPPANRVRRFAVIVRILGDGAVLEEQRVWVRVPAGDGGIALDAGRRDASVPKDDASVPTHR